MTIPESTAVVDLDSLYQNCVDLYSTLLRKSMREVYSYLNSFDLQNLHEKTKNDSLSEFDRRQKSGDDEMISLFARQTEQSIEEQFQTFMKENDQKRKIFIEKIKFYNIVNDEIIVMMEKDILRAIEDTTVDMNIDSLNQLFSISNEDALEKFNTRKLGLDELSNSFRTQLVQDLINFQNSTNDTVLLFNLNMISYNYSMQMAVEEKKPYFGADELQELHQQVKEAIIKDEFTGKVKLVGDELALCFQQRMDREIDANYVVFVEQNNKKREEYTGKVNEFNENLITQIALRFDENVDSKTYRKIIKSYLNDDDLSNVCNRAEQNAFDEFDAKKMGADEMSDTYRGILEDRLSELRAKWVKMNAARKDQYISNESWKVGLFSAFGGIIGGFFGGLTGAIAGTIVGGAGCGALSWAHS